MQVTIDGLEAYLYQLYGGWGKEQGLFMKLVEEIGEVAEEIGEVAEVLNQRTGRKAPEGVDLEAALGTELADVIHYAVAIAAVNNLDLNGILLRKDLQASAKYHPDTNLASFLTERTP